MPDVQIGDDALDVPLGNPDVAEDTAPVMLDTGSIDQAMDEGGMDGATVTLDTAIDESMMDAVEMDAEIDATGLDGSID